MPPPRTAIDADALSHALRRAMTRKGYTQGKLARLIEERTGKRPAQSTVSNWTRGEKVPSTRLLPVVLDALGLSWADIGTLPDEAGEETPTSGDAMPEGARLPGSSGPLQELDPADVDLVLIPRLAHASAGDGYMNGDHPEIEGYEAYPLAFIRRLTHVSPDRLRAIMVVGDSMEPEILANSPVIYALTDELADHGLYVFAIDDTLLVKKVQLYAGGALEIIPANPTYNREMLLPLKEAGEPDTYRSERTGLVSRFRVIGRVVFYTKAV